MNQISKQLRATFQGAFRQDMVNRFRALLWDRFYDCDMEIINTHDAIRHILQNEFGRDQEENE